MFACARLRSVLGFMILRLNECGDFCFHLQVYETRPSANMGGGKRGHPAFCVPHLSMGPHLRVGLSRTVSRYFSFACTPSPATLWSSAHWAPLEHSSSVATFNRLCTSAPWIWTTCCRKKIMPKMKSTAQVVCNRRLSACRADCAPGLHCHHLRY